MKKHLLFLVLMLIISMSFSFNSFKSTKGKFQRDGYYFFLTARQDIPGAKSKFYCSEVMYFKGYDDCNKNLDYQYYGIVKEKFMKYLADKYKVQSVTVSREGGKKSDYGYIETKEIGETRLNKFLSQQSDYGNGTVKTDFNYNCSDLK